MWSDVIYELGPLVVGAVAAALIAAYLWSRSRVASLFMVVWFGLAAVIGQVSFFEGPLTWAESHALGFAAFGTLSFAPAVVLLITVFRSERTRRFIAAIPTWALLLTQAYRVGGAFWACVVGVRGVQDPRILRADSTRVGWAYAQNTPNNGSRAAVFEHEIGRSRVRSLFTKQLLYH